MDNKHFIRAALLLTFLFVHHGIVKGQPNRDIPPGPAGDAPGEYTLVWSDECDTDGMIDTAKWFHQTRLPAGDSWHNNEIQHYTDREVNTYNDSGYMHIVARKEEFTDQEVTKQFTSARLNSKFAFRYGKVEVRAQLPSGAGTWPAIWMLATDHKSRGSYWYPRVKGTAPWPDCGEIDIMEHWGSRQDTVSSALHNRSSFGRTKNKARRELPDASAKLHVYGLEWTPEKMMFSVDDSVHYTYQPVVKNEKTWPYVKEFYILLNVAILPVITPDFTESPMIIDYVRVYQSIPVDE